MTHYSLKNVLKEATLPDLGDVEYFVYPPRVSCGQTLNLGSADFYKFRCRISVVLLPDGNMRCHKCDSTEGRYVGAITKADRAEMRTIIEHRVQELKSIIFFGSRHNEVSK